MARRTLSAIVLALLAVAWPAAADGGAPADGAVLGPSAPDPAPLVDAAVPDAGEPVDPFAHAALSMHVAWFTLVGTLGDAGSCQPYKLTMPDPSMSLVEIFEFDPDGCVRGFVRRAIGWPPALQVGPVDAAVAPLETLLSSP